MSSMGHSLASGANDSPFVHEALLYSGADAFLGGTVPFIRRGLDAGEPVLVLVGAAKIARLRLALGQHACRVVFSDMAVVGANPARIIPIWQDFVREHSAPGHPVRGIGEPIWAQRSPAELVECHRHESLINLAFDGTPARLLCPYDTDALGEPVIAEALRTHPSVADRDGTRASATYRGLEAIAEPFDDPLPDPAADARELGFDVESLPTVRGYVACLAGEAGLRSSRRSDLVLAVNEIATNSVRHAGGSGTLLVWTDDDFLLAEVRDRGRIDKPLAGRERPSREQQSGRGLWIANQLCELVQVRSFPSRNAVRLHMRLG